MGLSKRYKDRWAVDHLDLRVEQGDIYGFIGQNGAGKSTTLKLLCGLARPTQGEALIFGKPVRDSVARRRVGALIEQPGLYPDLSGRENLRLYAALLGLDSPARQVEEILKTVGLSPGEKKPVRHYSMGMKQRLGVALALLGGPDLLLLDEPINGLDPEGIREMRELLLRLNRERGLTILVSSHILGELSKIATRYGIIQEGRMVEQITARELEQKCTDYLHLKADQPQKAAALLEREFHLTRWEMRPEGDIRIYEAVDTKAVGQILTQAGIAVEEMGLHRQDLESYFLERMGGADHV
jgi:ABC-2 type transport system ATP-binding protein